MQYTSAVLDDAKQTDGEGMLMREILTSFLDSQLARPACHAKHDLLAIIVFP